MTALVGREVKAIFSIAVNVMTLFALSQPDEPKRQQLAEFGVAFGCGHAVGWEGIGVSHASLL